MPRLTPELSKSISYDFPLSIYVNNSKGRKKNRKYFTQTDNNFSKIKISNRLKCHNYNLKKCYR